MASRIAGITIEIGGDTSNLQKSLKGVDSQLRNTQSALRDVNKLLKLDPGNTELLTQKQKNLESAISQTKDRLKQLKEAQKGVEQGTQEWDALQREIIATEQSLNGLQKEYREFGSVASQQIKAAGKAMKDFGGKVESAGRALAPASAAAGAIGASMLKLGYNAVTTADELNTLSQQTGISTEEIQKMKYAADLVDVSFEDIAGAMRKMKSKMDPTNETFQRLGISVTNADGSMRDATSVFYDSISALSQIENETERDQVAMSLFGKSADELAGIIDDGGKALKEYGNQAEELGLIMSQDTLDALNETNDVLDQLKANVGGSLAQLGATLATTLAPALEKLSGFIGTLTEKIRNLTPQQTQTILKIVGIVAAISPLLIIGSKLISGISSLISVVGAIVGVLGGPLTAIIAAVIAAGILLYKNWDTIKETAIAVKDSVVEAWNNLKDNIVSTWENIKSSVTNVVTNIKTAITTAFDMVKTKVSSVIDNIKSKFDSFKQKIEDLKEKVVGALERIRDAFNFQWTLPHINLPHFRVDPGQPPYGIGGYGYMPSVYVDWYKKAYDNPVMFTSPTVLATPNGYKGFGDGHGAEIVMSLEKLREVAGGQNVTINVYASDNMNVNELADKIQARFVALANQRRLIHA